MGGDGSGAWSVPTFMNFEGDAGVELDDGTLTSSTVGIGA